MSQEHESFLAYAKELLDAYASREIEEVITPYGKKSTALKVANCAHFTDLLTKLIISEGMVRSEDFKMMDHKDPSTFGSRAHLHGLFRQDQDQRFEARRKADDDQSEAIRMRAEDSRRFAGPMKIDPELRKQLLEELRGGPKPKDPGQAGREAAEEVRRIMRGNQ